MSLEDAKSELTNMFPSKDEALKNLSTEKKKGIKMENKKAKKEEIPVNDNILDLDKVMEEAEIDLRMEEKEEQSKFEKREEVNKNSRAKKQRKKRPTKRKIPNANEMKPPESSTKKRDEETRKKPSDTEQNTKEEIKRKEPDKEEAQEDISKKDALTDKNSYIQEKPIDTRKGFHATIITRTITVDENGKRVKKDDVSVNGEASSDKYILIRTDTGEVYDIRGRKLAIGKDRSSDICIQGKYISRQHLLLDYTENELYVTDLGSTNGTYINGSKLNKGTRERLYKGDLLKLANINFRVESDG